jgi:hypothetical protein
MIVGASLGAPACPVVLGAHALFLRGGQDVSWHSIRLVAVLPGNAAGEMLVTVTVISAMAAADCA